MIRSQYQGLFFFYLEGNVIAIEAECTNHGASHVTIKVHEIIITLQFSTYNADLEAMVLGTKKRKT